MRKAMMAVLAALLLAAGGGVVVATALAADDAATTGTSTGTNSTVAGPTCVSYTDNATGNTSYYPPWTLRVLQNPSSLPPWISVDPTAFDAWVNETGATLGPCPAHAFGHHGHWGPHPPMGGAMAGCNRTEDGA